MIKKCEALGVLDDFIKLDNSSPKSVFEKFSPNGENMFEVDGHKFYFFEGTRDDRILLVAHADTVWDDREEPFNNENKADSLAQSEDMYYSLGKCGIGADDRAGAAMVWLLRNTGNSILITDEEEVGALTAKAIYKDKYWKNIIDKHCFILQLDMNGFGEFKCYTAGSDEFKAFIEEQTGFSMRPNFSYTDVKFLGKKICGANLSIGYYDEHTSNECLKKDEWWKTFEIATKLAENEHKQFFTDKEFGNKYKNAK